MILSRGLYPHNQMWDMARMGGPRHEEHVALYVDTRIEFFRIDYAVYFVFRCCEVGTRVVGNGAVGFFTAFMMVRCRIEIGLLILSIQSLERTCA